MNFLQLKINNKIKNKLNGFTLVETLVAISILLVAVVAPLTLITSNISSAFGVKDKIIALYLAEDAIDFVKYKIATNFNTPQYWLTDIPSCTGGGSYCEVDSFNNPLVISTCSGIGDCLPLKFDSATGIYGYVSGQDSKFTRTVTIAGLTLLANDPYPTQYPLEVIITATVEWQDHGVPKQTTISEHAFALGI